MQHIWPLSRHPELIPKGEAFIKKWGALGIFIGRFSGPLRASVPLVAGIFEMPFWRFQFANFISAFVWCATCCSSATWCRRASMLNTIVEIRCRFRGREPFRSTSRAIAWRTDRRPPDTSTILGGRQ